MVAGTGKPLRQFIYSRDLGKMFIYMLREYDDVEPVILSGQSIHSSSEFLSSDNQHRLNVVGEAEEITIKQVTDAIVKAVGFQGDYTVSQFIAQLPVG